MATLTATAVRPRRFSFTLTPTQRRALIIGLLFISPAIIGMVFFYIKPILESLYYSFTEFHVRKTPEWIGAANYVELFNDKLFWTSLGNTLYLVAIGVPLSIASIWTLGKQSVRLGRANTSQSA